MGNDLDFTNSIRAYADAKNYIVAGVNSPVRAFKGVDLDPIFIEKAKGSKIYDIDGNCYIDYVCSWGPMILGHAHPKVIKAISAAAKKGSSFGAPTIDETTLAKKIASAFKSIEKVRLVNSGTEAVMTAVRLARAYTKKDIIIKMQGCYHGHSDSMLVNAGSGLAEASCPSSPGVPRPLSNLTVSLPYNDINAVKLAFEKHKNKIAAVIIEPVPANMGVIIPAKNYLADIKTLCENNNSLLIFDEVITGFRLAPGGAQQMFGVNADLTCLGKIIGGGLPLAAIGGKNEIMKNLAPDGDVYQAGTLSGNPLATAAAVATLDILDSPDNYKKLDSTAKNLEIGLYAAARKTGIKIKINRLGSLMSCFFTDTTPQNFTDVQNTNIRQFKIFFANMLKNGVYLAPSAYEAMFISLVHSPKDINKTIDAAELSFAAINSLK